MMQCPECLGTWEPDCEQSICIEIHGRCFACSILSQKAIDIKTITTMCRQREQEKWGRVLAMLPSGSMGEYCSMQEGEG